MTDMNVDGVRHNLKKTENQSNHLLTTPMNHTPSLGFYHVGMSMRTSTCCYGWTTWWNGFSLSLSRSLLSGFKLVCLFQL